MLLTLKEIASSCRRPKTYTEPDLHGRPRTNGLLKSRLCERPKSAKARSRGKYGTRQCSECYGDRMLGAISMVDAAGAECFHNFRVLA
jgi:hypothetical protein